MLFYNQNANFRDKNSIFGNKTAFRNWNDILNPDHKIINLKRHSEIEMEIFLWKSIRFLGISSWPLCATKSAVCVSCLLSAFDVA